MPSNAMFHKLFALTFLECPPTTQLQTRMFDLFVLKTGNRIFCARAQSSSPQSHFVEGSSRLAHSFMWQAIVTVEVMHAVDLGIFRLAKRAPLNVNFEVNDSKVRILHTYQGDLKQLPAPCRRLQSLVKTYHLPFPLTRIYQGSE